MSDKPLNKILADQAVTVCQDIDIGPGTRRFLSPDIQPCDFLRALMAEKLWPDAVRFLARALPKRESTWWACLAARSVLDMNSPAEIVAALDSAEAWVYRPTEDNRRQAYAKAQIASFENPASWAAMAAFWSGGSMTPPDVPVVPPADNLTAKAVAGAIMLAAVQSEPGLAERNYQRFLQQGIDIASGGNGNVREEAVSDG